MAVVHDRLPIKFYSTLLVTLAPAGLEREFLSLGLVREKPHLHRAPRPKSP